MIDWKRLRYRLAWRLLGYRPHRLPESEGVSIVIRFGNGGTATIETSEFTMEHHTQLPSLDPDKRDDDPPFTGYTPHRSEGTFSGKF